MRGTQAAPSVLPLSTPLTPGPSSARIPFARSSRAASNSTRRESGAPPLPTLPASGCSGGRATTPVVATRSVLTASRRRQTMKERRRCQVRRRDSLRWTRTFSLLPRSPYGTICHRAAIRRCRPLHAQLWISHSVRIRASPWRCCQTVR